MTSISNSSNSNDSSPSNNITTIIDNRGNGNNNNEDEDGDEFISPQTPRVHATFSSSASSLVSTGTTSSGGIFNDIQTNSLNSGSLGDFNIVKTSFGLFLSLKNKQ